MVFMPCKTVAWSLFPTYIPILLAVSFVCLCARYMLICRTVTISAFLLFPKMSSSFTLKCSQVVVMIWSIVTFFFSTLVLPARMRFAKSRSISLP